MKSEDVCANHIANTGLIARIAKELVQPNNNKMTQLKTGKDVTDISP